MKRHLVIIPLLFFFVGCTWLQVKDNSDVVATLTKIAARRVSYYSALRHPDRADQVLPVIEQALSVIGIGSEEVNFEPIIEYLAGVEDDPLLAQDVADLREILTIQPVVIPPEKLAPIKALLEGMVSGIKMAELGFLG